MRTGKGDNLFQINVGAQRVFAPGSLSYAAPLLRPLSVWIVGLELFDPTVARCGVVIALVGLSEVLHAERFIRRAGG